MMSSFALVCSTSRAPDYGFRRLDWRRRLDSCRPCSSLEFLGGDGGLRDRSPRSTSESSRVSPDPASTEIDNRLGPHRPLDGGFPSRSSEPRANTGGRLDPEVMLSSASRNLSRVCSPVPFRTTISIGIPSTVRGCCWSGSRHGMVPILGLLVGFRVVAAQGPIQELQVAVRAPLLKKISQPPFASAGFRRRADPTSAAYAYTASVNYGIASARGRSRCLTAAFPWRLSGISPRPRLETGRH